MTKDEIIRMAREAGFNASNGFSALIVRHSNGSWVDVLNELELFAHIVAAAKQERLSALEQPKREPLTDALEALFTNIDHAISSGAWNVQTGSQTWEIIQEAKAAYGIGEKP